MIFPFTNCHKSFLQIISNPQCFLLRVQERTPEQSPSLSCNVFANKSRQCLPQSRPLHIKDFSKRIPGSKMQKQLRLGARRKTVPTTLWPREIRSTYLLVLGLHKSGETLVEPPAFGPTPAPSRLPFGLKAGNTGSSARKFCWDQASRVAVQHVIAERNVCTRKLSEGMFSFCTNSGCGS